MTRLYTLPCGCRVNYREAVPMFYLVKHRLYAFFDLIHTERFVRQHRPASKGA